ncbi:MAG TPA: hypothetical protein PLN52_15440 [Opitutaceae bacterium]|nr:hypothetical protein [Opitutaceae bacterium]
MVTFLAATLPLTMNMPAAISTKLATAIVTMSSPKVKPLWGDRGRPL